MSATNSWWIQRRLSCVAVASASMLQHVILFDSLWKKAIWTDDKSKKWQGCGAHIVATRLKCWHAWSRCNSQTPRWMTRSFCTTVPEDVAVSVIMNSLILPTMFIFFRNQGQSSQDSSRARTIVWQHCGERLVGATRMVIKNPLATRIIR